MVNQTHINENNNGKKIRMSLGASNFKDLKEKVKEKLTVNEIVGQEEVDISLHDKDNYRFDDEESVEHIFESENRR